MPIYKQNIDEARAVHGKEYKNYIQDIKDQNANDSETNESSNLHESLLSSITRSMILEFDANGDEKNIPGVSDDDSSDYSFDDAEDGDSNTDTTTVDSSDNNNNTADQQNSQEGKSDDGGSDEYSFGDDESYTQGTNDDSQENAEDNDAEGNDTAEQDYSSNEDEYNLDDGEDNSDNNDDTSNNTGEQQNNSSDDAGSDDYDFDSNDDNSSGSDLDGNNEDDAQSGLKKIEGELFENLSPKQKEIKIKALKQNFLDLYDRCGNVIDLISDNTAASEEESRIFDFVSKTVTELQSNVHDYLADTFGTKTYIDNDAQFKQYLVILDSVKKILDEFLNINTDKKEETGKK